MSMPEAAELPLLPIRPTRAENDRRAGFSTMEGVIGTAGKVTLPGKTIDQNTAHNTIRRNDVSSHRQRPALTVC